MPPTSGHNNKSHEAKPANKPLTTFGWIYCALKLMKEVVRVNGTGWLLFTLGSGILLVLYWVFFRNIGTRPDKKPFPAPVSKPFPQDPDTFKQRDVKQDLPWEVSQELAPTPLIPRDLPQHYGDNKMVILVKDPYWLYTYWEISAERWEELLKYYTPELLEQALPVLRVYDVTGLDFNGYNAHSYFDLAIHPMADNWYINVPEPNRTYCVDLGRLLPGGTFITLLRSNPATVPRMSVSEFIDEEWPPIQGIYRTFGRYNPDWNPSSPELMKKQ